MARNRKSPIPATPPIYAELCNFCDCVWPSHVAFHDVIVRGDRRKLRACQYCVFSWNEGPRPGHPAYKDPDDLIIEFEAEEEEAETEEEEGKG